MKRNLLYIDLFCGAGGTSTGVERARLNGAKCAKVIACVNHDPNAIASHAANHPHALHFTEDIRTLDLSELGEHTTAERRKDPDALLVLWASLECTNFSKARGGQPRDADSRTLAEHLFQYIDALQPDYIYIENVEEFMCWGDLDKNGKPISRDAGRLYMRWVSNVEKRGYHFAHRLLNAADYGARTARTRFFGIFAKGQLPIAFPEPTHCKGGRSGDMFHQPLKPWQPVRDVLELNNEGESIFTRKTPLCERTLERIYAGLIKFVAGGKDAFISRYNSVKPKDTAMSLDEPAPVVRTVGHLALVTSRFFANEYSGGGQLSDIESPSPAVTTVPKMKLVSVEQSQFLMNPQFASKGGDINKPCFTLIARMDKMPPYLVTTEQGEPAIISCEDDSPAMHKIKEFMACYCIVDIKMRMLNIPELKRIMGFGTDYVLKGTQTEQKKYIGNAVEVNMSRVLCEALAKELNQ